MKRVAATVLDPTHLELRVALSTPPGESIEIAIPDSEEDGPRPRSRHRKIEQEWRRSHREILLDYAGQWVVLEGEEIITHGEDPAQVVSSARDKGIDIPYIFFVDPPRAGTVKIGL